MPKPGVESDDASDRRGLAVGVAVAEDHVVDVVLAQAGAPDQLGQDRGGQVDGRERGQHAAHPAHRGAERFTDDDVHAFDRTNGRRYSGNIY